MGYRIVVLCVMVCAFSVSIYYRSRAASGGNRVSSAKEPLWQRIPLRLAGILGLMIIGAYVAGYQGMSWAYWSSPDWLRWLGVAGGVCNVPLLVWMFHSLGRNISPTVDTRMEHELVTEGPYRWIRHPLYTFASLLYISIALISQMWLILVVWVLAFALLSLRLPLEEAELERRFGERYREYREQTGRFFPRLIRRG